MSESLGTFRESNEEIYDLVNNGVYRYDPEEVKAVLKDNIISRKLSKLLNFYEKPNPQSRERFQKSEMNLGGTQTFKEVLKTFVVELSQKIELQEEQTSDLVRVFFIKHQALFNKLKSEEGDQVRKDFQVLFNPITQLYYNERITLLKTLGVIVGTSRAEGNPGQLPCLEFLGEAFRENSVENLVWELYRQTSAREIPQQVYAPQEREEWILQCLQEQKELLEILVLAHNAFAHIDSARFLDYLQTFTKQEFQGNFKQLYKDSFLAEYKLAQRLLISQIGDLSMFVLLSAVRLDAFAERGFLEGFNPQKNPYSLINNQENTPNILEFFKTLLEGNEFVSEHMGPVVVSWLCLMTWAQTLPQGYTVFNPGDQNPVQQLATKFYVLDFLCNTTQRETFQDSSLEVASALKYTLMSLVSAVQSQTNVEMAKDYGVFVEVTCACLRNQGSSETLKHFWYEDFPNQVGLYSMLHHLSMKFPQDGELFLKFVNVLIGNSENPYAEEVIKYLDTLTHFTTVVNFEEVMPNPDQSSEYEFVAASQLVSSTNQRNMIIIPGRTRAKKLGEQGRTRLLVSFNIRYSFWPFVFNYWETEVQRIKNGYPYTTQDLKVLFEYIKLVCEVVMIDPSVTPALEKFGLREPANHPSEVHVTRRTPEVPKTELVYLLLESFIELSKLTNTPLEVLSELIETTLAVYVSENKEVENHAVAAVLARVSAERHGTRGIFHSHPLFLSASKLRSVEKEAERYNVSLAVMELVSYILEDEAVLLLYPLGDSVVIQESLKFGLTEVLPECFLWPDNYKWKAANLTLKFLENLVSKYFRFTKQKAPSSNQRNSLLSLITTQLNKVDCAQFILHSLKVSHYLNELEEMVFENVHWTYATKKHEFQAEDLRSIKTMVFRGLSLLKLVTELTIYTEQLPQEHGLDFLHLIREVKSAVLQTLSEDSLPLVTALMSYIDFAFELSLVEETQENIALVALENINLFVIIWKNSVQKPAFENFFSSGTQMIKDNFLKHCSESILEKKTNSSVQMQLGMLELLVSSLPYQVTFCNSLFASQNFSQEFTLVVEAYKMLLREESSTEKMQLLEHYLCFYEQLVLCEHSYPILESLVGSKEKLISSFIEAVNKIFSETKEPSGFEACVCMHCYSLVFNLLTVCHHQNPKFSNDSLELVFRSQVLAKFLKLGVKSCLTEMTLYRMQEANNKLADCNTDLALEDFAVRQLDDSPNWKFFECNSNQYGTKFQLDSLRMTLALEMCGVPTALLGDLITIAEAYNIETSLLDCQELMMDSFKKLFGVLSSYGTKGEPLTGLPVPWHFEETKQVKFVVGSQGPEASAECFRTLTVVVESLWLDTKKELNIFVDLVRRNLEHRYQILSFCYNLALHITTDSKNEAVERAKDEFFNCSIKVLAEMHEFLGQVQFLSPDLLTLLILMEGFFLRSAQTQGRPGQFVVSMIPQLKRFLVADSPSFALLIALITESLKFMKTEDYPYVFKNLGVTRVLFEKITNPYCTHQDFLAAIKFCQAYSSNKQCARQLLSERILVQISNSQTIKDFQTEYEGKHKNPKHILWCWVLWMMNGMHDTLFDDKAFLNQVMDFLNSYSERITKVLRFNYVTEGRYGGHVASSKQFSLAYVEELQLLTSLLAKLSSNSKLWRSSHKNSLELWLSEAMQHTFRAFSSQAETLQNFPPISMNEDTLAAKTVSGTPETPARVSHSEERVTIFDRVQTTYYEHIPKSQASGFSFSIESGLLRSLHNLITALIQQAQFDKHVPFPNSTLLDSCKFVLLYYTKLKANHNIYSQLEKLANSLIKSAEFSLAYGSLNHLFELDLESQLQMAKESFEMSFYYFLKSDLAAKSELKAEAQGVLTGWIGQVETSASRHEPEDPFVAWMQEQVRVN